MDPERFTIRLDCPEQVLPSVPQAFLSVQGAGSDMPDPPTLIELPHAGTDRHRSGPLAVVMDRIDDATPPSLLGIDDEELNDPTHYVQNLVDNTVRVDYTFPNGDTISTIADVPKQAETVQIHVYGMGFPEADRDATWQRIQQDILRAKSVYNQMGLYLNFSTVNWIDAPGTVLDDTILTVRTAGRPGSEARQSVQAVTTAVNVFYVKGQLKAEHRLGIAGIAYVPSVEIHDPDVWNNVFISSVDGVQLTLAHELGHLLSDWGGHHSATDWSLMKDGGTTWNGNPHDSKRLLADVVSKINDNSELVITNP